MLFTSLLSGIGSAIGIGSSLGAASQRESIAEINHSISSQNASIAFGESRQSLMFDRIRNRAELNNATINYNLSVAEAEARKRNADRMRLFGEAKTTQSREAIRRQRRAFDQMQSSQVVAIGASGVEFQGSALDVLAESAGQMQLTLADMHDQANFERSETLHGADVEEFSADLSLNAASATMRSSKSAFKINRAANKLGRLSARSRYRASMFAADAGQMTQQDAAVGQRRSAVGQIFAGGAAIASMEATEREKIRTRTPSYQAQR